MPILLRMLFFFQVLTCVIMTNKAEKDFNGTEGGSVEISCKYPDGYQYVPMYFCRNPCTSSEHVLITSKKADDVVSKGRYTAINSLSTKIFSVTIKQLTLKDSGVYYCGVEKWFYDKLTKVKLIVNNGKLPIVSTQALVTRQNSTSDATNFEFSTTVKTESADSSTLSKEATSTTQTQLSFNPNGKFLGVCGGVLGLMLCCFLVTLVILYRKSTTNIKSLKPVDSEIKISPPLPDQEDISHVYDEILDVYSLAGPARGVESTAICSKFQLPAPEDQECNPYSFVISH